MIAKLSWNLLTHQDSLWCNVIRAKYGASREGLDIFQSKPAHSYTWKSIVAGSEVIKKGVGKLIFNGTSTRFWTDVWCGNAPLLSLTTSPPPVENFQAMVGDLWDPGTCWRWSCFNSHLNNSSILKIAAVAVSPTSLQEDVWS
ncbi:hypothetical protein M5689_020418 [Euphorbia peplus]|nr:hypothetical protein M5689_020418 [Euphorbia peplus]